MKTPIRYVPLETPISFWQSILTLVFEHYWIRHETTYRIVREGEPEYENCPYESTLLLIDDEPS